jgi:hypothetical protein
VTYWKQEDRKLGEFGKTSMHPVKLEVKFTLEQAMKAQRRSRSITLLFL